MTNPTTAGIGDITSATKGSGARFNAGKPPYDLVPLYLIAEHYARDKGDHRTLDGRMAIMALEHVGRWQARTEPDGLLRALDCLGVDSWESCARVFDYGRAKYAAWNWAKGMPWSAPLACAARHLLAIIGGEAIDPESGQPHRGHVVCNIVMLLTYATTYPEGDDRPKQGMLG